MSFDVRTAWPIVDIISSLGSSRVTRKQERVGTLATRYRYVVVGAGMAGMSAVRGIREVDPEGEILVVGDEPFLPYARPPLSKGLWRGAKLEALWDPDALNVAHLHYQLGSPVIDIDREAHLIETATGFSAEYDKLLLAIGGHARHLPGVHADIYYPGSLGEHLRLLRRLDQGPLRIIVVGGGFVGSEMAAALSEGGHQIDWIVPENEPFARLFPATLRTRLFSAYQDHGVEVTTGTRVESIEQAGNQPVVVTRAGRRLLADIVVIGAGWELNMGIAGTQGLVETDAPGILVDAYGRTGVTDIYAAGDIARLQGDVAPMMHEDRALTQGRIAGRNMAGAQEVYATRPFFYSDIYSWGYEAVGRLDTRYEMVEDWAQPGEEGVVYYLDKQRLVGILNWNVWDGISTARTLLDSDRVWNPDELRGRITNVNP